jgi:AcrR family transcriptional regulator
MLPQNPDGDRKVSAMPRNVDTGPSLLETAPPQESQLAQDRRPAQEPAETGDPARPGDPAQAVEPKQRRGTKGEQTRSAIAEAALRLFKENGYEATTMRAIAKEAGVATGNAYYYYGSKEELIQEFYARNQAEHAVACRQVLEAETSLGPRIRGVLRALIDVQAPYHAFAAKLYRHAAEPASPLSPFGPASSPTRAAAISLYAEVIGGARIRIPATLRSRLPELLWLYSMGIVVYWVHDSSPGCEKTYRLIDSTAPIAERLIRLARLPVLRSMTRQLLSVLDNVLN